MQTLLSFEQATVDAERAAIAAEQAARVAARKAKADAREAKRQAKEAKTSEWRRKQTAARLNRTADEYAQCGIRWYCRSPRDRDRGCYWTHCHTCGQALVYTTDPNAKPQECKRETSCPSTLNHQPSTSLNTTDRNAKPQECKYRH